MCTFQGPLWRRSPNFDKEISTMNTHRQFTLFILLGFGLLALIVEPAQAKHTHLYVDAAATRNGDGTRENPFWRITDAVVAARGLRQENRNDDDDSDGDNKKKILIHVLPGTYTGSYDPTHLASNPRLELLPIILNVSNLRLEGGTELDEDAGGLPTGTYPLEGETLLTTDLALERGQMLLLIATTTDGMAGNRVSVNGFVMDAQDQGTLGFQSGFDVIADRVSDFSIHHNLLRHGNGGVQTRLASGTFEANVCTANILQGIFITGGSMTHPARVTLRRNRSTQNVGGANVNATANFVQLQLGANTLRLEPLQTTYDANDPQDQQNIPNRLEVTIEGNDFSDNRILTATGLRCSFYPSLNYTTADATQPITGSLNVTVRDNRLNRNGNYGIMVDAGFTNRSNPRQHTGTFEGTFEHNALIDNGRNASVFDFTFANASMGLQPRKDAKYMQESTLQVADLDGELAAFDYDHPLNDPFDGSPVVGNALVYNGEVQPNGICITPSCQR
jgi:hypothetical protein